LLVAAPSETKKGLTIAHRTLDAQGLSFSNSTRAQSLRSNDLRTERAENSTISGFQRIPAFMPSQHVIPFGVSVDKAAASAKVDNGVLEVRVPKKPGASDSVKVPIA
jgi:hypothetical protein